MDFREIKNEFLNESLFHAIHESGLNVYVMPKKGYSKSYAVFATKYGSIDNKFCVDGGEPIKVPDGIAHFLEHKLFEQPDGGNVFDEYAEFGGAANAFTSFDTTAYLFSCTSNFKENLDILINFVQKPYFTDENVSKEQGIIAQEIRMYDDDPNWRVFFNMLTCLYANHPVRIDIAGTVDSISKIDKDILYKCYDTFYHPSNMILFCIGDISNEMVSDCVKRGIKGAQKREQPLQRFYPEEPLAINKKYIEQKLKVSMPLFQIGFKAEKNDINKDILKSSIEGAIMLELFAGEGSQLYKELYEQGLVNTSFSMECAYEGNYGFVAFGGESKDPKKVRDAIVEHILKVNKSGIGKNSFLLAKKKTLGGYMRQFNGVERLANSFFSNLFKGVNMLDYVDVYNQVSCDDVATRLKSALDVDKMCLSVIMPA